MKPLRALAPALALALSLGSPCANAQQGPAGGAAPPSPSATAAAPAPAAERPFVVGLQAGMGFPQPFSQLRNFGVFGLEAGYALPGWGRRLQLGLAFGYSEPGAGGGKPDPRLTQSGDYRFDLSQREYTLELGLTLRAFPLGERFNAYGRAAFRLYLLDTQVQGSAGGNPFGTYDETFTEPGLSLAGGVELRLGPGALGAELRLDYSPLNRRLTGDSSAGMLTLALAYRFFF